VKRQVGLVLTGIAALAVLALSLRAEDFSVHLDREADIDAARPAPESAIKRVPVHEEVDRAVDMPVKTLDVVLSLKGFGDVVLGQAEDIGPSSGKLWPKGTTATGGVDADSVRLGWLKGAPDILFVAWVIPNHPFGNSTIFNHEFAFLRLKDGRAEVLMRRQQACSVRTTDFDRGWPMESSRFSYDAKQKLIVETVDSLRQVPGKKGDPLARGLPGEDGKEEFSAAVNEKIELSLRPVAGESPRLVSASLVYETEDGDTLDEIARFYLGPKADRKALLDSNPDLAAKYKDSKPADPIRLEAKVPVTVPLPLAWFIQRWPMLKAA
jgi:hypothetical protein